MKITKHASIRLSERTDISKKKSKKQFFRGALTNGKSAGSLPDGALKRHLLQLESTGCKAKVYKGYIFIHSKNSKVLYTVYKIPEKLLEKVVKDEL